MPKRGSPRARKKVNFFPSGVNKYKDLRHRVAFHRPAKSCVNLKGVQTRKRYFIYNCQHYYKICYQGHQIPMLTCITHLTFVYLNKKVFHNKQPWRVEFVVPSR